jgi:DNA-directed RNA polymerase specialized sigma24 family protein
MATHQLSFHTCSCCSGSEQTGCDLFWHELHTWLKPFVLNWIYQYNLPIWLGQEEEIAADVLQETTMRILRYARQSALNNRRPIEFLENFCITVAHNCLRDLRRRQYKLTRLSAVSETRERYKQDPVDADDPSELALVHLMSRDTLMGLVRIIADFPAGQRRAILIDLAQYSDFDEETGPLHIIFLEFGINLHEYKIVRPQDSVARSRHAALLSIAYKRLKKSFFAQAGKFVA